MQHCLVAQDVILSLSITEWTSSKQHLKVNYPDRPYVNFVTVYVGGVQISQMNETNTMHQSSSGAAEYRPWSKHSKGSSRYAKLHQQKEQHDEDRISADTGNKKSKLGVKRDDNVDEEAVETNRKRDEFLSAMGVSTSSEQGGVISVAPFVHWSFSILSDHRTSHSCVGIKSHRQIIPPFPITKTNSSSTMVHTSDSGQSCREEFHANHCTLQNILSFNDCVKASTPPK